MSGVSKQSKEGVRLCEHIVRQAFGNAVHVSRPIDRSDASAYRLYFLIEVGKIYKSFAERPICPRG